MEEIQVFVEQHLVLEAGLEAQCDVSAVGNDHQAFTIDGDEAVLVPWQAVFVVDRVSQLSSLMAAMHAMATGPIRKSSEPANLERWPLRREGAADDLDLPQTMVCNTKEILVDVARAGLGVACLPDFMISSAIRNGELVSVLDDYTVHTGRFRLPWSSSKHLSVRLRMFIDFMHSHLFAPSPG